MASIEFRKRYVNRETWLLQEYNLTQKSYDKLLLEQNYQCKICFSKFMDNKRKSLCVDHNHKTGEVRGLLCGTCNIVLGLVKEDQVRLLRSIQYLKGKLK